MERPEPRLKPEDNQWFRLAKLCDDYLDEVESGGTDDSDIEHYIFESALELMYGTDVWEYVNQYLNEH